MIEDLCPRFGITSTLVDGHDLDAWQRAMRPNTKMFFFETPANPTLELVDIDAVARSRTSTGALVVVDNVFATPMLQKPLKLGADVVVYSATKHIDGQGRCLGGVVLGSQAYVKDHLHNFLQAHRAVAQTLQRLGDAQEPGDAAAARAGAMRDGAAKIADHLAGQKGVTRVLYLRSLRPSAGGAGQAADAGLRPGRHVRDRRRQAGRVPLPQRAASDHALQQPGRRQEPDHAPGHHHALSA